MHRDGFGFVIPDSDTLKQEIEGDIYISPVAIGDAMHGDRVLVELSPAKRDGRAEGRIIKIAGRAHSTVVGTFHYGDKHNYVTPIEEKIGQEVVIPRGMEIPPAEAIEARGKSPAEFPAARDQIVD